MESFACSSSCFASSFWTSFLVEVEKPKPWSLAFFLFFFFLSFVLGAALIIRKKHATPSFIGTSSSSSSSNSTNSQAKGKYDVFLSFRGEDTRDNFTSHLFAALNEKKIVTYIDNCSLVRGEEISASLLKAIEKSKISIVVLSQNYSSSRWCLEELVKILDCMKNHSQTVIPVFYRVHPSHVRNQTGSFGAAFAKHPKSSTVSKRQVDTWRAALKEVANLSGWDSSVAGPESELIKKIIIDTLEKLNQKVSSYYAKDLVGIERRIQDIESLLWLKSSEVRVVGIWGMGGLGKTTLARSVYERISPQFESCCFLSKTREQLQRCTLPQLQDHLFSTLLEKESLTTGTRDLPLHFVRDRLCRKKVVIVIDDVDNTTQLHELLLGSEPEFFGSGSRILITSRDKQVLKNFAGDKIYTMKELSMDEAIQLFNLNAFKQDQPTRDRRWPSERVINYAKGNPLAIKVLGSAMFGKNEEDWESALERLKKIPNQEICNVLRTSYDGLDSEEQNIFLDIACFFRAKHRSFVTQVLNGSYSSACVIINTLIDRSLIMIASYDENKLELHDLMQQMGRNIVLDESKKPENRSRLWIPHNVCHVLKENKGTEAIEGISLDMSKASEICLKRDAFAKMYRLKYLEFYWSFQKQRKVKFQLSPDGLQSLPTELRYLHWTGFPMKSLPSNFSPENLVVLRLPHSKVKKLWTGTQNLVKLKEIDLEGSKYLTRIPDLSKAINIEKIHLWGCESLKEIHSSVQYLNKLEILNLGECYKLASLPNRINSKVLKRLDLYDCSRVNRCPEFQGNCLEDLALDYTAIKDHVPATISSSPFSSRLVWLGVHNCEKISTLPSSFYKLKSLMLLYLNNWSELESFPEFLEPMDNLKSLYLRNCRNLKRLHDSIYNLRSLALLDLKGSAIKEIPSSIEHLSWLGTLNLEDCQFLQSLPSCIHRLPQLYKITLKSCKSLRFLPELPPSLDQLDADNCKSLETVAISFSRNCSLDKLTFAKCSRLDVKALVMEAQNREHEGRTIRKCLTMIEAQVAAINLPYPKLNFVYPGSEVPGWFSYQSTGSSVILPFPLNLRHFETITYCVVFKFNKSPRMSPLYSLISFCNSPRAPVHHIDLSLIGGTDHVLICSYSPIKRFDDIVLSFDFCPRIYASESKELVKHFTVKRCGIHLLQ